MYFVNVVYFCILYLPCIFGVPKIKTLQVDDDDNWRPAGKMTLIGSKPDEKLDVKRYLAEVGAGDHSEFLGSNPHFHESTFFTDLGRRFVPVYPYKHRVKLQKNIPEEIFQYIQSPKKGKKVEDSEIIPIRAPPEIVLAVMKNAKKMDTAKLSDPTEEVIREYMLRSGDYWNGVEKEEVDPDFILRTNKKNKKASVHFKDEEEEVLFQDSQPISAKLLPGTKLYELIAEIVKKAPRLIYIINDK